MSNKAGFLNLSIANILSDEQSMLTQARIRLLFYGLWVVFACVGAVFLSVLYSHEGALVAMSGGILVTVVMLFKYLTWKGDWKLVAHILLVMGTLLNLADAFIIFQKIDIISIQLVLLIIIFSFYMLGQNWGLLYSLANLSPVLMFMVYTYNNIYIINIRPVHLDQFTLILCVLANFVVMVFIHNHFYNAFLKNILELKRTSEEQTRLNETLEVAIDKAEKSSHAKSEFLSTMSHEIRTPLNAVIGMSNLLMMGNPRKDQEENLEILKFSANNLLAIVNDVLDFNKIESGKVVFENIRLDLPELLNNICGGQIIKANEKGLVFKLKIDDVLRNKTLIGDPTRITQIIFNLVSNAIKFTRQGFVEVKASCQEQREDQVTVRFSVRDSGIGIEQDNLKAIFEPFTQESITTTRKYGGTGLGLAIVKRLLELKGIQMQVTSKPGQGSEFWFDMVLPLINEVAQEPVVAKVKAVSAEEQEMSDLHILVAEDNMVNTMLMKKFFSKWHVRSTFAENGERAVEMMSYGNFDIVLMDLQMPVLNGFDAAMEIRKMADHQKAAVPIIALTASALTDIREKVFSAGMNDYVAKPFKPDELKEKILKLVHHRSARRHQPVE
ncbi:response regulator [Mucilaginibacter daejeonensis]|uniref:ATP-binding protein n=1 Tax=Mucilaginibacter daejeonensis TaxID=398049 RepID=UPI001D178A31|nr:ATP-binding protein [Mucilaginibacter daejeonensis]UEG54675.1 response regulator [Mucilaginibacter daejeonensis]